MQNILMDIILSVINALMAIFFVSYFCNDRIQFHKKECLFAAIIFIGNLCGNFLNDFSYSLVGYNLITFLIIIIITLIITSIYSLFDNKNTDIFKKVISPFIFLCAFIISNTISAMIVAIIFKDTLEGAFNAKYFEKFVFIVINLSILIIILLISIKFHKKLNTKKMLYLLIPLPFVSSIALLLFSEIKKVESIYQFYYITEIYYSIVIIISAFATFGIYFLLYQTHLKNQIEKEKELYKNMLRIENKRYEDLKNNTEQIQKIRHDIKNMLYCEKGKKIGIVLADGVWCYQDRAIAAAQECHYNDIDIIVCTSKIEGTPNPVLEGMACGDIVVSTDVGIVPDVLGEKQAKFILEERSKECLKQKIIYLVEHRDEFSELREENLESIQDWTWKKISEKFKMFFDYVFEQNEKLGEKDEK